MKIDTNQPIAMTQIIDNFNHDDTLIVYDVAKYTSFPAYNQASHFVLHIIDDKRFEQFVMNQIVAFLKTKSLAYYEQTDIQMAIQELVQTLGETGKLNHRLNQYGLTITKHVIDSYDPWH